MNKSLMTVLIVAVLALGGGAAYYIFNKANQKADTATQTSSANQKSAEQSASNSTASQTSSVAIKDMAFSPANISVKKGTKVTWTNDDSVGHSVISENDGGPHSSVLSKGQSYSFTFDAAGTFNYICGVHPSMKGKVTVTE